LVNDKVRLALEYSTYILRLDLEDKIFSWG
jgi:hypothetical protein